MICTTVFFKIKTKNIELTRSIVRYRAATADKTSSNHWTDRFFSGFTTKVWTSVWTLRQPLTSVSRLFVCRSAVTDKCISDHAIQGFHAGLSDKPINKRRSSLDCWSHLPRRPQVLSTTDRRLSLVYIVIADRGCAAAKFSKSRWVKVPEKSRPRPTFTIGDTVISWKHSTA